MDILSNNKLTDKARLILLPAVSDIQDEIKILFEEELDGRAFRAYIASNKGFAIRGTPHLIMSTDGSYLKSSSANSPGQLLVRFIKGERTSTADN